MKKPKVPKEISAHFSRLGKRSWKVRAKKILEQAKKVEKNKTTEQ